ncbi:hypothetical protein JB92DRAFT_2827962 [Gautieria morchelliformis]|nr:hypothetical protein JB92DRAFT_2827962 [Gautieria morchelliformis]
MKTIIESSNLPPGQKYPVTTRRWAEGLFWNTKSHCCIDIPVLRNGQLILGNLRLFECISLDEHKSSAENKTFDSNAAAGVYVTSGDFIAPPSQSNLHLNDMPLSSFIFGRPTDLIALPEERAAAHLNHWENMKILIADLIALPDSRSAQLPTLIIGKT